MLALTLLFATNCEWFRATDPGAVGKTLWYETHTGYSWAQPALDATNIFIPTGNGRLIVRDKATGALKWGVGLGGTAGGDNIVVRSGVVVVPLSFSVVAVDAKNGAKLWTFIPPLDTAGTTTPGPGSVVFTAMDADETTAYLPAWGGSVTAVDLQSGAQRWQWNAGTTMPFPMGAQGVRVSGNHVFVSVWHWTLRRGTDCDIWVVALNRTTGAEQWRQVVPGNSAGTCVFTRPAVVDNRVAVQGIGGTLFAFDTETGAPAWTLATDPVIPGFAFSSITSAPAEGDGVFFSEGGVSALRAVRASDGAVLWRTRYAVDIGGGGFYDNMLVTDSYVYGTGGDHLFVFDKVSGELVDDAHQPGMDLVNGGFAATPTTDGTTIYAPVLGAMWAFREHH